MVTVAHVTTSLKRGGAEEVLCSLVEQLNPSQITSHVIYFHEGPHSARLRSAAVPVYHVRGFFCTYDPVFWYRLIRVLITIKPDCIHALLWSSHIACRIIGSLLRIPVITVYHNQVTLLQGIRAMLDVCSIQYATQVIAVSQTVADSLTARYPGMPLMIIQNGINVQKLDTLLKKTTRHKASLHIPESAQIIGTVGRLHPIKNQGLLLEAYCLLRKELPHTYLLFVGDGPEYGRLVNKAHHLQIAPFVIFVTQQQAYDYYHLFDCFVLSSAQEGMSIALLEAHYFKRASVVTHNRAKHDVITHGYNGLLTPTDNASSLAYTIGQVLQDEALKQRLGVNAHTHVIKYHTAARMAKQYEQQFQQYKATK